MAQAKHIQAIRSSTVLSGTGRDVIRQLNRSLERRTVAVTFADGEQGAAAERVIHQVVQFLPQLIQERQEETESHRSTGQNGRLGLDEHAGLLAVNSGDFLPATEVAKLAGFSASNLSVQPNKWKRNREIFAIQHGREDYLPLYGLDPGDHRPRKEIAEALNVFGNAKDGWGLAFWFAGLNSFLDDERPQDVLATDPSRVVAAAKDENSEFKSCVAAHGGNCRSQTIQDILPGIMKAGGDHGKLIAESCHRELSCPTPAARNYAL